MEEIEFSRWLFEGRLRQGKNVLPDGLNWLCYFSGSSKSHRENSNSLIFLESPQQADMKNIVKSSKHFFGHFNTLETQCLGIEDTFKFLIHFVKITSAIFAWSAAFHTKKILVGNVRSIARQILVWDRNKKVVIFS